jgi:hypothetical protein
MRNDLVAEVVPLVRKHLEPGVVGDVTPGGSADTFRTELLRSETAP